MKRTSANKRPSCVQKCLAPGCKEPAVSRGLCTKCYQAGLFMTKNGKVTWEQLEKLGLAIKKATHHTPLRLAVEKMMRSSK